MRTPTPVKLHEVPKWLKQRIQARLGRGIDLHEAVNRIGNYGHWLDHYGSTADGRLFVSEPYGLGDAGLRGLMTFAELMGLKVRIEARGEWNPSEGTIRIVLEPKATP